MILTCPSCVTRYHADGAAFPPEGRTVRCAACAHSWRALPSDDEGETLQLASATASAAPPPPANADAAPLPQSFRAKAQAERATRQAMAAGVVWAMLGAGFLVLLGGAALFRVSVVRLLPVTAGAYAAVHMPVNPTGMALEQVQGGPGLQDGRAVLIVTGAQRNIETAPRAPSAVKVALFDKAGRAVASQIVHPNGEALSPGDTRLFRAVFENPPIASAEFGVDFAFEPKPLALNPAPPPAIRSARLEPVKLVGPVREAAPIPTGSPYGLPTPAGR